MLTTSTVIFGVVLTLLVASVLRRRGGEDEAETVNVAQGRASLHPGRLVLVGGVVVPAVVLVTLWVLLLRTMTADAARTAGSPALVVDVTGRQWFWDVDYPASGIRSANEIHIPAKRLVELRLRSGDVNHSLWIPRLQRKLDMLPGQRNVLRFTVDEPGLYRGECAEYCGMQHAKMGFVLVAHAPDEFDAWLLAQGREAPIPRTPMQREGQQVVLGSCSYCHTIAGTNATGRLGPDLTHLASRRTLGATTVPNTPGELAGWILDAQHVKPGNKMPSMDLDGRELQAVLAYLRTLR